MTQPPEPFATWPCGHMPWLPAAGYAQVLVPGATHMPGGHAAIVHPPDPFATWPCGHMPWLPAAGYAQVLVPGATHMPGGHAAMTHPPEPSATCPAAQLAALPAGAFTQPPAGPAVCPDTQPGDDGVCPRVGCASSVANATSAIRRGVRVGMRTESMADGARFIKKHVRCIAGLVTDTRGRR